jgi:integrase/transposase-like protein
LTTQINKVEGGEEASRECSECHSRRIWKDGIRETKHGPVQRFLCRDCGTRFSEKSNKALSPIKNCQLCAVIKEAKKLDSQAETKTVCVGEKSLQNVPQESRGLIAKFMAYLERQGYYEKSAYLKLLKILAKDGADLTNPEDVKTKIAQHKWVDRQGETHSWKNSTKILAVCGYDLFCKMEGISWEPPKYKAQDSEIYVPDEKHLDELIIGSRSKRMSAFLQCLKETFADPGEILKLEWIDIKGNVVSINHPVKGHLSGRIEVTNKLIGMLNELPKVSKRVFPMTYQCAANSFQKLRKRLAHKLQEPELLNVSFKSYRHWGGSMLNYYTNGNVTKIQKALRHKSVLNTMKYIHTIPFKDEDFEIAVATTPEDIKQLGKAGWTKYDEMVFNGAKQHFYRKPKKYGV